jgi:hypothetical protein
MPIVEKHTVVISCDNPACPGNDLKKNSRDGWTFVTADVYGAETTSVQQYVYCSAGCAATVGQALAAT